MMGTPWETQASVDETISFAKELRASISTFFVATPYPGTELRKEFIKAGWCLPESYTDFRQWSSHFTARPGKDPGLNLQECFAGECRRAKKEIILSHLRDFRHYPELIRAYFIMYTFGELSARVPRELTKILRKF